VRAVATRESYQRSRSRRPALSVVLRPSRLPRDGDVVEVRLPSGREFAGRAMRLDDGQSIRVFIPDGVS